MKIGILTYHRAHNYGALLQAYALLTFLQKKGHSVEFVDYWPIYHQQQYALIKPIMGYSCLDKIKNCIADILTLVRRYIRIRKFKHFCQDYLKLTPKIKYTNNRQIIKESYDLVIVGSDQVWRHTHTNGKYIGFDYAYFCQMIPQSTPCITYAASMGVITMTNKDKKIFNDHLRRFTTILVRENSLKALVEELNYRAQVVLDPTFLLTKEQWNNLLPNKRFHTSRYVLYYDLIHSESCIKYASYQAKELGCKLLIMDARVPLLPKLGHISYASPIEFLHAIRDAEFVIATSFHGTAFSIIFEKQFLVTHLGNNADRVQTLLHSFHLEDCYQETPHQRPQTNYNNIKYIYDNIVDHSSHLLIEALFNT